MLYSAFAYQHMNGNSHTIPTIQKYSCANNEANSRNGATSMYTLTKEREIGTSNLSAYMVADVLQYIQSSLRLSQCFISA